VKQRWLPVGVLALAIFVINVVARFVSWRLKVDNPDAQSRLGAIGVIVVGLVLVGASTWWSVRFPFGRVVADLGLAVIVGTLLALVIGPFAGGSRPFAEGLESFVGEMLLFFGVGAVAGLLGFVLVTAIGRDWRGRSLKRYERRYARKPHKPVRG